MTPRRSQRTQKENVTDRKIGVKVARDFETGVSIGQVTDVTIDDNGDVLYSIEYEDGDEEDFDEKELKEGVSLYHRTQKEKLGIKIAKYFDTDIFIGEVKKIFHNSGEVFYNIEYEDGDGEDFDEKELREGIALYQHTQKEKLGVKVAKHFESGIFIGEVKHVIHDRGVVLYTIEYEDGDVEDFDEKELQEGIALCQHTQKEKLDFKVGIALHENEELGVKVAKRFDTDIFIGEVKHVVHDSGVILYTIEYEDGDGEDLDEKELQEGIALYQHTQKEKLGVKVAKRFGTGTFVGEVKDVIHDRGVILYTIEYEDGDGEDFDEKELEAGIALYHDHMQKQQKRTRKHPPMKNLTKKKVRPNQSVHRPKRKRDTSPSFGAVYDDSTPIHTLILGTYPSEKSLSENRYFAHPNNAFWWIAGDCLGFRRDEGEKLGGGLMKFCEHLFYDESYIVPYDEQIKILCQNGFALWDVIASCQRKGSLDSAIQNDKPNDIQAFVEEHPTIKTIVMANGKSGLTFFNRHFRDWFESGRLVEGKFPETTEGDVITCVCAPSVSPAHTIPYEKKRMFWQLNVYSPGLKLHEHLSNMKKLTRRH